jgi:ribosome-binding factor A
MSLRIQRVAELVKRELSMILEKDYSFGGSIVTIHEARPTPDLKQCFVYVGILGPEEDRQQVMDKLNRDRPFMQRALHKRMTMKNSPQIFFRMDTSIERGVRILNAIDNLPPPADPLPEGEEEPEMK